MEGMTLTSSGTISIGSHSCQRCGRGGLYSVTYINGLATCSYCVIELGKGVAPSPPLQMADPQILRALIDIQGALLQLTKAVEELKALVGAVVNKPSQ